MKLTFILIIFIVVIIVCTIENKIYSSSVKDVFKCPNTFSTEILSRNNINDEILIYNINTPNLEKSSWDKKYQYTYIPKILMSTRLHKPFKDSINLFKQADKTTIATDVVEGFLPFVNYTNTIILLQSNYRVMSNIKGLKITSNEDYIFIK